jgi:hypothetical protein
MKFIYKCRLPSFKHVCRSDFCIRGKDQQDAHFYLITYLNYIILVMLQTNNCSSSGGLYRQMIIELEA